MIQKLNEDEWLKYPYSRHRYCHVCGALLDPRYPKRRRHCSIRHRIGQRVDCVKFQKKVNEILGVPEESFFLGNRGRGLSWGDTGYLDYHPPAWTL